MWYFFNYFSRSFLEKRTYDIAYVLLPIKTHLSRVISIYFMSQTFEYKDNDYPDFWDPKRDINLAENFMKKYKFNFYDNKFDFDKFVKCVEEESKLINVSNLE